MTKTGLLLNNAVSAGGVISLAIDSKEKLYCLAWLTFLPFALTKSLVSPLSVTPNNTKLTIAEIPPVIDGSCLTVFLSVSWRSLSSLF